VISIIIFIISFQIEITKVEINSFKNLKSTDVSVKGIKLKDPIEKVLKVLGEPTGKSEEKGIFVYPDFIVKIKNGRVNEISIKSSFAESITGEIAEIFRDEIFTDKGMREKFLGEETKIEVELIELSQVKVEKWKIIFKNGFMIEGSKKESGFTFQFLTLFIPEDEKRN
jgi:hypothetical protein